MKWLLTFFDWILDSLFGPAPKWGDEAKVEFTEEEVRKKDASL